MNLVKLIEDYGSEDKCRAYLEELRWPNGVECPRCEGTTISRIHKRNQFDCDSCRYQFSVTAGKPFHDSHFPLWKWFLGIYLIGESKKGISGKQLERTLGVSYKTAWYLGHRIRAAMEEDSPIPLRGIVEIDETWLGGKKHDAPYRGPFANKTMILGAVERGGKVRLRVQTRRKRADLHGMVKDVVADDAEA